MGKHLLLFSRHLRMLLCAEDGEAEGIDKKAEAMKKYGEAAVIAARFSFGTS